MWKTKLCETTARGFFPYQRVFPSMHEIMFIFDFANMSVVQICPDQKLNT